MFQEVTLPVAREMAAQATRIDLTDFAARSKENPMHRAEIIAALKPLIGKEVFLTPAWGGTHGGTLSAIEERGAKVDLVFTKADFLDEFDLARGPYPKTSTLRYDADFVNAVDTVSPTYRETIRNAPELLIDQSLTFSRLEFSKRAELFVELQKFVGKVIDVTASWGTVHRGKLNSIDVRGKEIILVCGESRVLGQDGKPSDELPPCTLRHSLDHVQSVTTRPMTPAETRDELIARGRRQLAAMGEMKELVSGRSDSKDEHDAPPRDLPPEKLIQLARHWAAQYDPRSLAHFMFGSEIMEHAESGKLSVEWNGHMREGKFAPEDLSMVHLGVYPRTEAELQKLLFAIRSGEELEKFETVGRIRTQCTCPDCGMEPRLETNGKVLRVADPCAYPKGHFPLDVELNVPSGKIVFANDLREWFPIAGSYNVNLDIGVAKTTKRYAEVGMAHCHVGNTSPEIVQSADGSIAIVAERETEWDESENYEESADTDAEEGETLVSEEQEIAGMTGADPAETSAAGESVLGRIDTRLWWWSGVDYDELKLRTKLDDEGFAKLLVDLEAVVASVEPGTYNVRHFGRSDEGEESGYEYSKITRTGDAKPRQDFEPVMNFDITAGQIFFESLRSYPGLYFPGAKTSSLMGRSVDDYHIEELRYRSDSEVLEAFYAMPPQDQMYACMAVANHLLLVIGNGCEIHPSGWIGDDPDITKDSPAIKIPPFIGEYRWYPASVGYSKACVAVGMGLPETREAMEERGESVTFKEQLPAALNPSFKELLFNTLQAVIRYGFETDEREDKRDAGQALRTKRIAEVAFARLASLYPGDVPEYCKDLVGRFPTDSADSDVQSFTA